MTFLRKMMLTHLVGWPYKALTNEGGAPLAPRSSPLFLSKRAAQATLEPAEAKCGKPEISIYRDRFFDN
jgi:hypothetical protein